MSAPATRALAAAALLACLTLAGRGGGDSPEATSSADNTPCQLVPPAAVAALVPGAKQDDTGPNPLSCSYGSSDRRVTLSYFAEDMAPKGPGGGEPSLQQMYDVFLFDAANDGAAKVRAAPALGDSGKLAIDADERRLVALWRRDDAVYTLDYLFGNQPSDEAIRDLTAFAGKVKPPG